jgi:hypothetical protein
VAIAVTEDHFTKPTFPEVSQVKIQTMKTIQIRHHRISGAAYYKDILAQERRFANLTNPWNGEPEDTSTF